MNYFFVNIRKQYQTIWIIVFLGLITILPRVLDLDRFLTADERRWHSNVSVFTRNLAVGEWKHLLQLPHPGITLQWLGAITVHSDNWTVRKLPLAIGQSILIAIIGYIFWRLWGKWPAALLIALLALNPFLIAHTRVYAMDSLLALFVLLSLGCFLLWHKTSALQYIVFSGIATALAVLSKLPGILLIPFITLLLFFPSIRRRGAVGGMVIFLIAFIITAIIVLPSLLLNTESVLQDVSQFFTSADYETLHQASPWYYVYTVIFYSTPLHMLAILALPFLWIYGRHTSITRKQLLIFLAFALLFVIMMTMGQKKGDRYILPVFLIFDVLVVAVITWAKTIKQKNLALLASIIVILGLTWQGMDVIRLHPYALAYVNPVTKSFFDTHRSGWGEGLDIAASYLNNKPNAQNLKVASFYPNEFANFFNGQTVPLHQFEEETVDYAVVYRAMFDRGADAWETDVLNKFKDKTPEKVIRLNNIDYVWIYSLR